MVATLKPPTAWRADAHKSVTALIYTRVSSDDQADDGRSLPAQVTECRRYVARQGWDFGDEMQDIQTGR